VCAAAAIGRGRHVMTGSVVLLAIGAWTVWLLWRDVKERKSVSPGAWVVVAWTVLYGSRPVTSWFAGGDYGLALPERHDEGTPAEALVHLSLIVAGLSVLVRRGVRVSTVIDDNRWLFALYVFWVMSVLWSDVPLVTAKRLFKDLGNIVMALVILTAREPSETAKAVFARCAYLCIPLSIVLIRYYPELGRAYSGYSRSEVMYVGVATHKNALGTLALVTGLCLLWDLLDRPEPSQGQTGKWYVAARALVLAMCWYLLLTVDSVTALICAVFGSALLVSLSTPWVRRNPGRLEAYGLAAGLTVWLLDWTFGIRDAILLSLGRDTTLTTRTEIWPILLKYQDNVLVGAGFNTYWAGQRLVQLWQYELVDGLVQAHSGYVETYLSGGAVGLGLLVVLLMASYGRIRKALLLDANDAAFRYAILLVAIIYNGSEASFNKLSLLWFMTVFAVMAYGSRRRVEQATPVGRRWRPEAVARP
jgi:O-antigen ligase